MRATVLFILCVAAGVGARAPEVFGKTQVIADPTPPDFKELLQILLRQQSLKLGSAVHHEGCVTSETLGDYLATLIANGSSGEVHTLAGTCATYDPKKSVLHPPRMFEMFWECRVRATTGGDGGKGQWRYELAVLVDQATRKMDPKTLACPSGP